MGREKWEDRSAKSNDWAERNCFGNILQNIYLYFEEFKIKNKSENPHRCCNLVLRQTLNEKRPHVDVILRKKQRSPHHSPRICMSSPVGIWVSRRMLFGSEPRDWQECLFPLAWRDVRFEECLQKSFPQYIGGDHSKSSQVLDIRSIND